MLQTDDAELARKIGIPAYEAGDDPQGDRRRLRRYLNVKLAASGLPTVDLPEDTEITSLSDGLLAQHRERTRLMADHRCPADRRVETFLAEYFGADPALRLPDMTLVLDRHGLARQLSLPHDRDEFRNDLVESYRVANGVLHNPRHDRRTTKGTFHVVEGGLPVPGDKKEVPKVAFERMFRIAMSPPTETATLPFTATADTPVQTFVSLLLRPLVIPEVPGVSPARTMETRFVVPGSLVSNLDFVESIFGNAGDPYIPANDAGLDVEHWTGHTGCVILAPQLETATKKELGLPHVSEATERQIADGMCWTEENDLYNEGTPFKVTCRDTSGVVVTIIADNYFGYCKKEVKTQLSYAANLLGNAEEEHAGGALAFASYSLGDTFQVDSYRYNRRTFDDVVADYSDRMNVKLSGYATDKLFPELVYIPEQAEADLREQVVRWERDGEKQTIPLMPNKVYMAPSGYQLRMEKHPSAPSWRLIGTVGEGIYCHKPCTVSGGGKSEISKSLRDYMLYGPIFVADLAEDFALVESLFAKDYSDRWSSEYEKAHQTTGYKARKLLSSKRTLGSVIKLLTPSPDYREEYNDWLRSLPSHVLAVAFIIKRFYDPAWKGDWQSHFGVDIVNGEPGHELKIGDRKLVGSYLRVGLLDGGAWRTYKLRQDFAAAAKVQTEDDITASTVVPTRQLSNLPAGFQSGPKSDGSVKFAVNCESRLFQRPDDAVHRGLDKQTERDLAQPANFISNFQPLTTDDVQKMRDTVVDFDAFTPPMQQLLESLSDGDDSYVVCSANPRLIDGKPTKNPRYLQLRPDLADPLPKYVAEMGTRLFRAVPSREAVHMPVGAVLSGRRNNPPEDAAGIRGLAVYNPIHYQELPELFMDYVCSLTGKSPSTTGAGSEGALTKGPFNMLRPAADLNAAFVAMALTDLGGFSTAAGHIGPNVQVDHDISLLIPEIWCRLSPEERDPRWMLSEGLLAADYAGVPDDLPVSRLGFRITADFVRRFFGRIFDNPDKVFDEAILRPETQSMDAFVDGVRNIVEAQEKVARRYFEDGTADALVPPLRATVAIMAFGDADGLTAESPEFREMFTREAVMSSAWYADRLSAKQRVDRELWRRHVDYLEAFGGSPGSDRIAADLDLAGRANYARRMLDRSADDGYAASLRGTIGVQPEFAPA